MTVTLFCRQMTVFFLILTTFKFTHTTYAETDDVIRVFLFAGQSNMVGADAHANRIDDLPEFKGAGAPQDQVLYSYILGNGDEASKGWGPLRPLSSFGPELTFARMVTHQISSPIAIIKSAVGGTTVAFDWYPDAPENGQKLYPRTLQLVRDSLQELDRRGLRYRLEGVMWHQGENDMLDRKLNTQYADGLTRLITRLRADLKAPDLKWYMAEVSEKGIWGMDNRSNLSILRQQQDMVRKTDPPRALGANITPGVRGDGERSATLSFWHAGPAPDGRSVCRGVPQRDRPATPLSRPQLQE